MVEFIGFIISFLALLYLFIKQNPNQLQRQLPNYQNGDFVEDDPLNEFIKAVEKESAVRETAQQHMRPPPPPKIKKQPKKKKSTDASLEDYGLRSDIEMRRLRSSLEDRKIEPSFSSYKEIPKHAFALSHHREELKKSAPSRAQLAIQRLAKRRDIIIYQEMISKPKSL